MEFKIKLTREDLSTFNKHVIAASPQTKKVIRAINIAAPLLFVIIGLILTGLPFGREMAGKDYFVWIYFGVVIVLWFLIMPKFLRSRMVKSANKNMDNIENEHIFQENTYIFGEDSIKTITQNGNSEINWVAIKRVEYIAEGMLIYISGTAAYFLPYDKLSEPQTGEIKELLNRKVQSIITFAK